MEATQTLASARGAAPDDLLMCETCPTRRFALCEPVDVQQLSTLRAKYFVLASKEHLYHQGMQVDETYSLCEGQVMLYRILKDGKRQVIKIALPGDFVGIGAQPNSAEPIRHSAMCLTDSAFCVFPHLAKIAKNHSDLAARLASLYAEDIALKNDYLTCIARRNAAQRVAFLALDLYHRLQLRGLNRGDMILFPLTQQDMADALGLTGVHVNRVLSRLENQGLLEIKHHELTILDHKGLSKLVNLE